MTAGTVVTAGGQFTLPPVPVEVGPSGHELAVGWAPVAGATAAEVDQAAVTIIPELAEQPLGSLPLAQAGSSFVVTLPGSRRLRRLTLAGLERQADDGSWVLVRSQEELGNLRLVVTVAGPGEGFGPPQFSVPPVGRRGMLPAALTGATLATGPTLALTLPDPPAQRVRLSLASGSFPEEFEERSMRLGAVGGTAAQPPTDLQLTGPDGATTWALPGRYPPGAPAAEVDLRLSTAAALTAAVRADGRPGGPLRAAHRLRGAAGSRVRLAVGPVRGALLRSFPGVLSTTVAGAPTPVALAGRMREVPLAAERPAAATADLTVRYDGLRLLEDLSDPMPTAQGGIAGQVVGEEPVARLLPPAGLGPLPLARVGLVGRAGQDCELSVGLVTLDAGRPGAPLGPPGVAAVPAARAVGVVWVDLPPAAGGPSATGAAAPLGLAVRATRGRFLWAGGPEPGRRPLALLAVRDPAPPPAPLRLAGVPLATVGPAGLHLPASALPPGPFSGPTPLLDCALFVTVDLSDLVLRYAR
jgi:hypothetical protein